MDFDINDLEPKGPIPTETELARLLCDRTFVDYFNIFLSLPIFAQRLLYRFSEHVFELDPPLKRTQYRLDRVKLMRWVRTHRAPLFFKTDLYLHYILCKHLLKTHLYQPTHAITTEYGLKDKTLDRRLLSKCLRKASGMRRFRMFLVGTAGERGYEFWIDAERFRKATKDDKELSRELFREISAKYYKNGVVMELWDEWKPFSELKRRKRDVMLTAVSDAATDSSIDNNDILNTFTIVQGFILKSLQNYWVPRFLIRCKATWMKNREVQKDIVYQPDCCVVHVRSLSELADTDDGGAKRQEVMSDNIKVARKTHLKSQSVNNLLSMFTSSSIRRSELAAMLKLEDTGETTTANKDQYDENEWNTSDGFPLPTISEEDISEEPEQTTPPPEPDAGVELILTPKEEEQQQKTEIVPKKSEVIHEEVNAVEVDLKKQISKETVTQTSEETPTNIDETMQQITESDEDKKQETTDDDEEKRIDNEKFNQYHERFKKMAQRRRQSFATPELLARDSSSSSMRRLSWSSSGVASLRRISTGSFTTEKQVIATKTPVPPKKRKYKPQKRQQAMSVEFRLGDFSMLMQSLTNESSAPTTTAEETTKPKAGKKGKKKPLGDPSLEDALKLGLPQLQADILALQKVNEDGPKKKKKTKTDEEPPNKTKEGRRSSIKAGYTKMAGGGRRKASSGRRGSGVMAPLTKANLARLEQIANKAMGKSDENEDKLKLPEINKKSSIISIGTEQTVSQSECDPMVSSLPSLTNKSQLNAFHKVSVTEPYYVYWNLRSVVNKNEIVSVFDTIVSDRLAGGPFENFLRRNGQQQNINCLKFWQKSEDYLNTAIYQCDVSGHRVRYITAMHIKTVYLACSSSQCIQLKNDLMEKLAEYMTLDSYVADEFVRYVQGLVCEKLREVLQLFKKYDGEDFLNRTTRKKAARFWMKRSDQQQAASVLSSSLTNHQQSLKKDDIIDDKSGDATTSKTNADDDTGLSKALVPRRMIQSLERAKSLSAYAKNQTEDSMADLSDLDSDSDDEGSLKPTKIKVIRKCKEEVKLEEPEKIEPKEETKAAEKIEIRRTQPGRKESKDMLKASSSILKTIEKNGKTLHRPLQPKSFSEILRDSSQLEFFKRFLAHEKSDLPILFWQSVENMKSICKDAKSRQMKTNQIVRKYFNKSTGNGSALQCSAEIIEDIPYLDKVTPQMIMSAQACVAKSIEDNWFELYRHSFPEEEAETSGTESLLTIRIMEQGQKSKALWGMFISNVASVKRGLMNPVLLRLFEKFVQKEVHKDLEKQKQTGVQSKRMICNKVVIVDRIQNDLRFWAEVERYKQLTDDAARAASQGTYTIDDEEFVQLKARAIISCYIDSHVPPKLQINISQELADQILDTANNGLIERGLFHDATVSIFAVVLYCWKKFCRERIAPAPPASRMEAAVSAESATLTKPKTKKRSKKSPLKYKNGQYKLKHVTGTSADDPPKITFNLQQGLELILPPKPKSAVNHDRYRNMMRQLYQSGEFDSGGTNDILLNAMQQSSQGMSAKQHRRFSQSINTIRQQLKFAQQFMPAGVPN